MLHHPDFTKPFYMNCDASDVSLGSVLYQEDDEENHRVISFASRILNSCERNYNVTDNFSNPIKELIQMIYFRGGTIRNMTYEPNISVTQNINTCQ